MSGLVLDLGSPDTASEALIRLRKSGITVPIILIADQQPGWEEVVGAASHPVALVRLPLSLHLVLSELERLTPPPTLASTAEEAVRPALADEDRPAGLSRRTNSAIDSRAKPDKTKRSRKAPVVSPNEPPWKRAAQGRVDPLTAPLHEVLADRDAATPVPTATVKVKAPKHSAGRGSPATTGKPTPARPSPLPETGPEPPRSANLIPATVAEQVPTPAPAVTPDSEPVLDRRPVGDPEPALDPSWPLPAVAVPATPPPSVPAPVSAPPALLPTPIPTPPAGGAPPSMGASAPAVRHVPAPVVVGQTAALVDRLLALTSGLTRLSDAASAVIEEAVDRTRAMAGVLLLPDGPEWRVEGFRGLRPLEERLRLTDDHWLVETVITGRKGILIEDSDITRERMRSAPLASRRQLLALPFPQVAALLLLSREEPPFTEADLSLLVGLVEEAESLLVEGLQLRALARALAPYTDLG